ncbi:hypothetical protein F5Y11DRAFT_275528 [Daldinia sp. FL1419]|nr:hypothetical protein F5Y11DRAFT_275528 [Daldinia sp. FL1419]
MNQYLSLVFFASSALRVGAGAGAQNIPDPLICEDTLDGSTPPFKANAVPCLLRCQDPVAVATGSLLPGSINETNIPYCQLNCVHSAASPAQSALAPDCYRRCAEKNSETPENVGWCMYWCADGFGDVVEQIACIPSLKYGPVQTTVERGMTITYRPLAQPPEWQSWYKTQTVIPYTGNVRLATPETPSPTSSHLFSAPYRVSPSVIPKSTSASSRSEQATPTLTSGSGSTIQSAQSTGAEISGETVTSTTTPAAAGRLSQAAWLGILGVVGFWIVIIA